MNFNSIYFNTFFLVVEILTTDVRSYLLVFRFTYSLRISCRPNVPAISSLFIFINLLIINSMKTNATKNKKNKIYIFTKMRLKPTLDLLSFSFFPGVDVLALVLEELAVRALVGSRQYLRIASLKTNRPSISKNYVNKFSINSWAWNITRALPLFVGSEANQSDSCPQVLKFWPIVSFSLMKRTVSFFIVLQCFYRFLVSLS